MCRRSIGVLLALGTAMWMTGSVALPLGGGSGGALPAMSSPLPSLQTLSTEPFGASPGAPLRLSPSLPELPDVSLPTVPGGLAKRLSILDANGQTAYVEVLLEDGWRAVEHEWLLLLDVDAGAAALSDDPLIKRYTVEQRSLPALGKLLIRLRVPARLDSRQALEQALPAALRQSLDRHHVFSPQAGVTSDAPGSPGAVGNDAICPGPVTIGMIDTAIELNHPGLATGNVELVQRHFGPPGLARPEAHGTAVAGRMVGRGTGFAPLIGQARVVNASVFYGQDTLHQGAAMVHLLEALDWLSAQGIPVINMSLAGPDNVVLRQALDVLAADGVSIVAAAGNQGPAAPPAYPAAYRGVVAATAVDGAGQLYRWANRGEHIDFAAPGVRVMTTRAGGGFGPESGTSMAAPVVSAFVACALKAHHGDARRAVSALTRLATDLGEPERDSLYGFGLLAPGWPARSLEARLEAQ